MVFCRIFFVLDNFCKSIAETIELSQKSDTTREEMRQTVRNLEKQLALVESKMVTSYDDLFQNTVESARKILQADRCTLWIADSDKKELWSIIAQGMAPIRVPNDKGIVGACFHTSNCISIPDAYQDHWCRADFRGCSSPQFGAKSTHAAKHFGDM